MAELFGGFKGSKPIYNAGFEASKEYLEGARVKTNSPKIRVLVNPFFPPFLPLDFISQDMGGLIQNCQWSKSRNQAHGSWTIIIADDSEGASDNMTGWPLNFLWKAMGKDLRDIFKPMAISQLWIDGYHLMTGFVRLCRRQVSADARPTYMVQFDEMGALYNQQIVKDFLIGFSEEVNIVNNPTKSLSSGSVSTGFRPLASTLNSFVNAFIQSSLAYGLKGFPKPYLSGSDGLPLAFRLIAEAAPIGGISNSSLLTQLVTDSTIFKHAGSSFWEFLKSLTPEPFIELFTESGGRTICTGKLITSAAASGIPISGSTPTPIPGINVTPMLPGFNYLILRTSPYDNPLIGLSSWHPVLYPFTMGVFDLLLSGDFGIITDDDVISKDLGQSDLQQYTIFDVNMNGKNASGGSASGSMNRPSIASGPLLPIFPGGIRTFGNRLLEQQVDSTSLQWQGVIGQSIQRFSRKLTPGVNIHSLSSLMNSWFRNAAKFNEGTIVVRNKPYLKPGMSLLYLPTSRGSKVDKPRDIGIYYIDNITGSYSIGTADTMQLSVIRGTPIPNTLSNLVTLLMDWEIIPPGLNIFDGEIV